MEAIDLSFEDIKIGDEEYIEKDITSNSVDKFAELSGDYNPLHTNKVYAESTKFQKQVVHGMYLAALVSQLIGMRLPGKRALILKENLEFKDPVFIGDKIKVLGRVIHKSESTKIIEINIEIYNQKKNMVSRGTVHAKNL